MIALIVGIILLVVCIILLIVSIVEYVEELGIASIVTFIVICLMLSISLVSGMSIHKRDNTKKILAQKEQIEYLLENNISVYVIEQAQDYNREVDSGNNLWCRFSIEDRNEYKIDIDKYIKEECW